MSAGRCTRRGLPLTLATGLSVASAKPLRVALNLVGRMVYLREGVLAGALPALFAELAARSGLPIQPQLLPRARAFASFLEADGPELIIGVRNRQLQALGDFVPMALLRMTLIVERQRLAEAPSDIAGLLEHSDWRGLYMRGAGASDAAASLMDRLEQQHRLWRVRDWATVLRMLLAGRAEFGLYAPTLLHGEAYWMGADAGRLVASPLRDLPTAEVGVLMAARLPAELRQRLVQQLLAIRRDGSFRRLVLKEHPPEVLAQDFQFLD